MTAGSAREEKKKPQKMPTTVQMSWTLVHVFLNRCVCMCLCLTLLFALDCVCVCVSVQGTVGLGGWGGGVECVMWEADEQWVNLHVGDTGLPKMF